MAYVISKGSLPAPVTGAEWVLDIKFNAAERFARSDPEEYIQSGNS